MTANKVFDEHSVEFLVLSSSNKVPCRSRKLDIGLGLEYDDHGPRNNFLLKIDPSYVALSPTSGSDRQVQFNSLGSFSSSSGLWFGNDESLNISGSVVSHSFTGSLTQLSDGNPYILGQGAVQVTTNSLGQVLVSGSINPTSTLNVKTLTGSYIVTTSDSYIETDELNVLTSNISVYLPTTVGNQGKVYYINKADATGYTITVIPSGSQTISGQATKIITNQWDTMSIISNGSAWRII